MEAFVGHSVPGLSLIVLGLWHTANNIEAFCRKGSDQFTVRFWHPYNCRFSALKHLELIFILSLSILAIFIQVSDYPHFRFAFKLENFEHATMYLHLAVFAGFTICADRTHEILSEIPGILLASAFGQELFLINFHSADHVGLEGHYQLLLQIIVLVSFVVAALSATTFRTSFLSALVLSILVTFQGCWFLNIGFMLGSPVLVPQGCTYIGDALAAVICGSHEADVRARALANLQFSWILCGILIYTGCMFLISAKTFAPRSKPTECKKLHKKAADSPIAISMNQQAHP